MIKSSYTRDQIETCVRELILATNNSIASQSSTELVFTRIGRLQIRHQQVKFKFYKNFISTLDSSGKIMNSMQNRPGTADSVMSERPQTRSFSNVIPLPRISLSSDCQKLPTINELDMFESKNSAQEEQNILQIDHENHQINTESNIPLENAEQIQDINNDSCHKESTPVGIGSNFLEIEVNTNKSDDSHPIHNHPNESVVFDSHVCENETMNENLNLFASIDNEHAGKVKLLPTPKPPSRISLLSETKRPGSVYSNDRPITSNSMVCGHPGPMGQELCYVCYQREKRNIPVYFTEQLKEREKEEERVLQAYQNMKDTEKLRKEQENLLSKKHDSQKISAFNAGVAEAVRVQQKSKDANRYRSYLFQHRPLTPPKSIKQNILSSELDKQIERKLNVKRKNDEDVAFMERLEQMQLAEDLAKQREKCSKDKENSINLYKKALDTQVTSKTSPIPRFQPDSDEPFFGKNDVTEDKLLEKRQKAQEVLKHQMECAERKKRDTLLQKIHEHDYEEKMLKKIKSDLVEDRAKRHQRSLQNRMKLENEWEVAKEEKKERDLLERLNISIPDNVLMHEQCDKYSRCAQCKRKVQNNGHSNIWKETYYIPGTRYIC